MSRRHRKVFRGNKTGERVRYTWSANLRRSFSLEASFPPIFHKIGLCMSHALQFTNMPKFRSSCFGFAEMAPDKRDKFGRAA